MRKIIWSLLVMPAMCFTACSDDENESDNAGAVDHSHTVSYVDASDNAISQAANSRIEYDAEGYVTLFESRGSDYGFFQSEGIVLERQESSEYKYDLDNGKITITAKLYFPEYQRRKTSPKQELTLYRYSTLYVSNNRIDSIHMDIPFYSEMNIHKPVTYLLTYSDDNHIQKVEIYDCKMDDPLRTKDRKFYNDDVVIWENGNPVSIDRINEYLQNTDVYRTFCYSDIKGYLPDFNIFTMLLGTPLGLLGEKGFFGEKPVNLMSRLNPIFTDANKESDLWEYIDYTFGDNGLDSYRVYRKTDSGEETVRDIQYTK